MKFRAIVSSVILLAGLTACQTHSNSTLTPSEARELNARRSKFDSAQDPPLTAETHFAAGQLAEAQHSDGAAVKQYNEALKLDPNHLPSLYRLGMLYTEHKAYPDAIEFWQKYVKATNYAPSAYANLGFCNELAGQQTEAENAYKTGIEKDPKNLPCRTNYGLMLARHNHIQEAIRIWQPVLTDAEIHYNLASVDELDNRKEEAKAEYKKALDLDPKFDDAKSRLAALD